MKNNQQSETLTFWDHLDVMRGMILRSLALMLLFSIVAFLFKDLLFDAFFAPRSAGFPTYRLFSDIAASLGLEYQPPAEIRIINTGLARQFMIHMKAAFCVGFLLASPYMLGEAFRFLSPALYERERCFAVRIFFGGYIMFLLGLAVSYLLIFPMTFQFLGTYQVSSDVDNLITLDSYMSVLLMLSLCMGIMFEMPVVAWLLAKAGILKAGFMTRYRKHAIVVILTAAAVITPTSDVFTLLLVAVPIYLLFELSVLIVRRSSPRPDPLPAA